MGNKTSIHREPWPEYNTKLLVSDTFTLVIQVNGKVRDSVEVSADITEAEAKALAMGRERVQQFVGKAEPKKTIYVPGRLINIVI